MQNFIVKACIETSGVGDMVDIKQQELKSNGSFGILSEPHDHKQHPNQQCGLDKYISLVNFSTGERCHKKLYQNTKGLHFKHPGGVHYLNAFTKTVVYVPFQIIEL